MKWGDDKWRTCSLCGEQFQGMGNNPEPLASYPNRCCDECNETKVLPARLRLLRHRGH